MNNKDEHYKKAVEWAYAERDWSKASDDELIAEAKRRYPKGVRFHGSRIDFTFESTGKFKVVNKHVMRIEFECADSQGLIYNNTSGKWAEIVSQPKEGCKKSCADNYCDTNSCVNRKRVLTNPIDIPAEPKAGDMVEVRIAGWPMDVWKSRTFLCKNSRGKFVCEYSDGGVEVYDHIRLPQKSEVESKAKEFFNESFMDYDTFPVFTSEMKSYGINCIKWGQQNPEKPKFDEIIKELELAQNNLPDSGYAEGFSRGIDKAIEIVKSKIK